MRVERLICTNCLEQCSKQVTEGLVVLIVIMRETRRVNNVTFNDSSRNRGPHWRDKCKVGHLLENKCKVLGYLLKYFFFQTVGIFFFFFKAGWSQSRYYCGQISEPRSKGYGVLCSSLLGFLGCKASPVLLGSIWLLTNTPGIQQALSQRRLTEDGRKKPAGTDFPGASLACKVAPQEPRWPPRTRSSAREVWKVGN